MSEEIYIGNELELFEKAVNWKRYYKSFFKPYIKGRVLEAGAGIGGTTRYLCDGTQAEWLCLEPDKQLISHIDKLIANKELPACCKTLSGTLENLASDELFDTILYIDVIEHIEDDAKELRLAASHLKKDGMLLIIVPAHQWLFSPFDKAIGHYRRYNLKMMKAIIPANLITVKNIYLDSVGMMASSANKLFLKQSYPTQKQVLFWDKTMVPFSKIIDPLLAYSFGKSVMLIAKNTQA